MKTRTDDFRARRMLCVAIVTETYPPEVNGVALTLERVVEGLWARGHEIQLIRPRHVPDEAAPARARLETVLVRGLPVPGYAGLRMGEPSMRRLLALWRRQRPHLVHIATEGPLGWSALRAAERLRLPVCSDFRTNFHAYSRHYGVAWLERPIMGYLRAFHNRTAITMVPTEALRQELSDRGFERVATVARGVDTDRFDPAHRSDALRRSWGADPDTLVALFVGRLASEKNLGALVAAIGAMRQARPAVRAVIVGDGPQRDELRAALPHAVFAGTRSGADLAAHYASADAFIFPSMTETFGNVTPEAMASALPVVAYDHAAAGQLIDGGRNGLLARYGDEAQFIDHAARLALDREAALAIGRRARATACEQGWERIVAQIESVFLATLASATGAVMPDAPPQPLGSAA